MGRAEFEEWSDRIIGGALIPGGGEDPEIFRKSQQFALADMIKHLGPTESHKPDAHFIHSLRRTCANQVAHMMFIEIKAEFDAAKAKKAMDEANQA